VSRQEKSELCAALTLLLLGLSGCAASVDSGTAETARGLGREVDGARVFADVEALAALHAGDAPVDCRALNARSDAWCHLTNAAARHFVEARFTALGLTPVADDSAVHPATSNVVAELRGTSRPDEVVLIGAHFDAFFQGADDNSSGVAVMLEVARVLAQRPRARTVRFVGFDHEEIGLVGSTRHVASSSWVRPKVSLVLDCAGYADATPGSQGSLPGFPVPPAGDFLAAIANDVSRARVEELLQVVKGEAVPAVQAIVAPGLGAGPLSGNLMRSDHAPFWLAGESALFFTDTANFRNANYHEPTDTPDTLDRDFLTGVARITTMSVATWGDAP
jgi:Zn-dependent M28 family amino/carboxypeptidase